MKVQKVWNAYTKECTKCRGVYYGMEEIKEGFGKDTSRPDGFHPICRICRSRSYKDGKEKRWG